MQRAIDQTQIFALLSAKTMLTIDEVCLFMGLSKAHIYRLTCTHSLPYYKPNGKQIYFDKKEIENWMHTNRVNSQTDAEAIGATYCVTGKIPNTAKP